jgi:site-specific DNA-methyltransferase (adenine-specific)
MLTKKFSHGTIYKGDCLEVMHEIPEGSVDAIITDLPYGTTACAWDTVIPFAPMWEAVKHVLKSDGVFVTTSSQPFTSLLVCSNLKWFRYDWIWEKTKASGHLNANRKPMKNHEEVLVFGFSGLKYNPQGLLNGIFKNGRVANMTGKVYGEYNHKPISQKGNFPKTILKIPNPSQSGHLHPTQKPVALMEYLIRTYTNKGDTVLDMCIGSGTTAVAAFREGRKWIGIEKDPEIFDTACQRIKQETKQQNMFSMDGVT